jgi:hypothetical protein
MSHEALLHPSSLMDFVVVHPLEPEGAAITAGMRAALPP